jgi:GT2 family glycosyltransferase
VGFGRANNQGFDIARGRYILILNPDTILQEDTLAMMAEYMDENNEVGIAGCKVLNDDGTFQVACRRGFPTPWAAFSKLFGLQSMFPKSKLFAKYNQTFRSEDETYYIDAVIGAFMFARAEVIDELQGFDPDFFMYGEDLDLCYRTQKIGYKIAYYHETSIVHFKGESTSRSSINEVKHFYEAMEIFARKHFGSSRFLFSFLKLGIVFRQMIAYLSKNLKEIFLIIFDLLSINTMLMVATKVRFGDYLSFPDYAYPIVFIVASLVLFGSMVASGEYFEENNSSRKAFGGIMLSFFLLSTLTYFFKDFAFSRGVLLLTIGLTMTLSLSARFFFNFMNMRKGALAFKRIAFVGNNEQTRKMLDSLDDIKAENIDIAGVISLNETQYESNLEHLGHIGNLKEIISDSNLSEIIITDTSIEKSEIMNYLSSLKDTDVKIHFAQEYDDFVVSRVINEVTGNESGQEKFNIDKFRLKVLKRIFDISFSSFLLTLGLPLLLIHGKKIKNPLHKVLSVFSGKMSFVGIWKTSNQSKYKQGICGLAHLSNPEKLSQKAIENLNEYYLKNYSISLDIDIFLKFLSKK